MWHWLGCAAHDEGKRTKNCKIKTVCRLIVGNGILADGIVYLTHAIA